MESAKAYFTLGAWARGFLLVVLLAVGFSESVRGQSTATVKGTVTDASDRAVAGAKVVVRNAGTGVETTTTTDSAGAYQVPPLLPGVYQLTVSAANFQTFVIKSLELAVASTVEQNVQLRVGSVEQQVVITSEAPLVDTSTVAVTQVINQKTVQEIPLNGRHFVDLSLLTPGTVAPPANGFLTAPLRGQGSFGVNTAGQREDTVNFMINGINLNDMSQNQITFHQYGL